MTYRVIKEGRLPIYSWCPEIEEGAMEQARNLSNLPFAFHHIALMPDCHRGFGMPIGAVCATQGVIVPNMVGVDIGCGVRAVQTRLKVDQFPPRVREAVYKAILDRVPVGMKHRATPPPGVDETVLPSEMRWHHQENLDPAAYLRQIGTLGGGNHFIEIQADQSDYVWIMVHSGSRGVGKYIADFYNDKAKEENIRWFSAIPPAWDLAFLLLDSPDGQAYFDEMCACVVFAAENRKYIAYQVLEALELILDDGPGDPIDEMDVPHNYAAMEHHYGQNVIVHRKGATRARLDRPCIIPGSQGTASYVGRGKGSEASLQSCSHGAGRVLGRKQAIKTLDLKAQQDILDGQGIVHGLTDQRHLDEAPSAYKDIEDVMINQADLVRYTYRLRPLIVVKGTEKAPWEKE